MSPEEVWRSRCAKMGWRCSKCAATPLLSDALNFFRTGLCETCLAERKKLYERYDLTKEEIAFIESTVKPMVAGDE